MSGKYKIKAFKPDDLRRLKVNIETKIIIDTIGLKVFASKLKSNGPAYTAFYNGEPFAMGGINLMWKGVGEAWAFFGTDINKHGYFIHRNTIRYLKIISDDMELERVQAAVLKGHWAGIEWINRLGFSFEGEMIKYFRGKTYLRFAKCEV